MSLTTLPSELLHAILSHLPHTSHHALLLTGSPRLHLLAGAHLYASPDLTAALSSPLLHRIVTTPAWAAAVRELTVVNVPHDVDDDDVEILRRLPRLQRLLWPAWTQLPGRVGCGDGVYVVRYVEGVVPRDDEPRMTSADWGGVDDWRGEGGEDA
ncbi:hypothetical protein EDC01DRAFT_636860 [Geopyxis carbonaria]|nr:hypothetical protein EDC01DRAFT_636860 [Geopyxis carbonaria]